MSSNVFQPSEITLSKAWLATKEEVMKDAISMLKQVTGMVNVFNEENKSRKLFLFLLQVLCSYC
jgi:hypothetical protein